LLVLSLKHTIKVRAATASSQPTAGSASVLGGHVLVQVTGFETERYLGYKVKDGIYRALLQTKQQRGGSVNQNVGRTNTGYTEVVVVLHAPHVHALAAVPPEKWIDGTIILPPSGGSGGGAKERGPTVRFMEQEWFTQLSPLPPSQPDDWKSDDARSLVDIQIAAGIGAMVSAS
jgi:hypothetical protein